MQPIMPPRAPWQPDPGYQKPPPPLTPFPPGRGFPGEPVGMPTFSPMPLLPIMPEDLIAPSNRFGGRLPPGDPIFGPRTPPMMTFLRSLLG